MSSSTTSRSTIAWTSRSNARPPAYRLQFQWLKEQGVADPMKAAGVDALTLYLAGTCQWE